MSIFGDDTEDLFIGIADLVERWVPQKEYKDEDHYRDDLMGYLRNNFTRSHIMRKESGRSLADIAIDRDVGIELKLNFTKNVELDRLKGQLMRYEKEYTGIIVVLCGKSNPELVSELEAHIIALNRQYYGIGLIGTPEKYFKLIEVLGSKNKNNEKFGSSNSLFGDGGSLFDWNNSLFGDNI